MDPPTLLYPECTDFKDTWVPEIDIPSPAVTVPPLALMVLPEMVILVPAVSLSCFPVTVACNAEISFSQVPTRLAVVDKERVF